MPLRSSLRTPLVLFASAGGIALVTACADMATDPRAPSPVARRASAGAPPRASVRWNALALSLVSRHRSPPPRASRVYAYLSVAQDEAIRAARAAEDVGGGDELSLDAAVLGASTAMLTYFFVQEDGFSEDAATIAAEADAQWHELATERDGDVAGGELLGRGVAEALIERARNDGSAPALVNSVAGYRPTGEGYWVGASPQLPGWGRVRPWFMTSGRQFHAPPPPAWGSPQFLAGLAEVRQISDTRSAEQLQIAQLWADGAGTSTPPGHWNAIAADLIARYHLNEKRAAHVLALTNTAMMDAMIACWESKYSYWVIRPYQADPAITTPIGQPPHPSYPSGHSCSSTAGARVLGYLFPEERDRLAAMATTSGLSRIYGGIHYRFDTDAGAAIGRAVAELAIAADRRGERLAALGVNLH